MIYITILIVVLAVVAIALVANYFEDKIEKEKYKMSFKESLDLVQLPIVTFQTGSKKLNFILDSGSSTSYISKSASNAVGGEVFSLESSTMGASGSFSHNEAISIPLTYKDETVIIELLVSKDLDNSFDSVKKDSGVQIHGILGTNFLSECKYIMDFDELVAYHK